jgi:hypothetical protein
VLLKLRGKSEIKNMRNKDYRNRVKKIFLEEFGYEAHKIKDKELERLFKTELDFKNNFPELYKIFK